MTSAEVLRELHFNPLRFAAEGRALVGYDHFVPLRHYLLFVALLSALEATFGAAWLSALVVLNAVAQAAAAAIVLACAARVGGSLAVAVAVALLVMLFDSYQWVAMSQSEPLFTLLAAGAIATAVGAAVADSGRARALQWAAAVVLTAATALTRPPWPPVLVTVLTMMILAGRLRLADSAPIVRLWILWVSAGAAATVALIYAAAALALDPALAPTEDLRAAMKDWRPWYAQGMVVNFRPETYLPADESLWGFARLSFARLVYFFWFTADGFSASHRWINIAGHVPLYTLALFGSVTVIRAHTLSRPMLALGLAALTYVLATDAFHAITSVDYDWRYRAPIYPWLIVLAVIGTGHLRRSRGDEENLRPGATALHSQGQHAAS